MSGIILGAFLALLVISLFRQSSPPSQTEIVVREVPIEPSNDGCLPLFAAIGIGLLVLLLGSALP